MVDPVRTTSRLRRNDAMERERIRSLAVLTAERSAKGMGGDVLPLTARIRKPSGPAVHWSGLDSFLAALPRVFPSGARGRADGGRAKEIGRSRSTFGNDAA